MTKYIIKGCGNINEIEKSLKTIRAMFGKGATLSTVARYLQVKKTIDNQLKEIYK